MTEKEYQAIKEAYMLLSHISIPSKSGRIPLHVREKAKAILKDFPHSRDYGKYNDTFDFFNPR